MRRDRRDRCLAAVAMAAVLAAGCSAKSTAPNAPPSAGAGSATGSVSSATTSAPSGSASASATPQPKALVELARAVRARIDSDATAMITTQLDLGGNHSTGNGVVRYHPDAQPDLDVTTALPAEPGTQPVPTRLVAVGKDTFANFARTGAPAQWIALSPNGSDLFTGLLDDLASSLRQAADPQQFLTLAEAAGTVTASEKTRVADTDTAHYSIHVDVAAAGRTGPVAAELLANGVRELDFQLWVDAADRPVQLASSQRLPKLGTIAGQVAFQRWGQPVQISAPPAAQVTGR